MWDLPGPGLEPVSSALAGGFLNCATREVPDLFFFNHGAAFRCTKAPPPYGSEAHLGHLIIFQMDESRKREGSRRFFWLPVMPLNWDPNCKKRMGSLGEEDELGLVDGDQNRGC